MQFECSGPCPFIQHYHRFLENIPGVVGTTIIIDNHRLHHIIVLRIDRFNRLPVIPGQPFQQKCFVQVCFHSCNRLLIPRIEECNPRRNGAVKLGKIIRRHKGTEAQRHKVNSQKHPGIQFRVFQFRIQCWIYLENSWFKHFVFPFVPLCLCAFVPSQKKNKNLSPPKVTLFQSWYKQEIIHLIQNKTTWKSSY